MFNKTTILCLLLFYSFSVSNEPWISTDNLWVRADIELLANIGIIGTPTTTWPLTWGPILKDLKNTKLSDVPSEYRTTYYRVLNLGRRETGKHSNYTEFRVSLNSEPELLRYFGDKSRAKKEVSSSTKGMTKNFAWNLEATLASGSVEGEKNRYDGSYIAGVFGNWIYSIGQIERWWGPGWQNSLILSNNARPVPAVSFQRNYSEPFESSFLNWIGPWTFSSFAGLLDDERTINNTKLLGMSFSFKPFKSLEVGLRRTAQWGGQGRPENFDSLINLFVGLDNCDEGELSCEDLSNEPGNQLAAIDLSWKAGFRFPLKIYIQMVGEDEAGYFPSKKSFLLGGNFNFSLFENPLLISFESAETKVDGDGNTPGVSFSGHNVLYEHFLYRHGYRYINRVLGATIDNDSSISSLNFVYKTKTYGWFSLQSHNVELNKDAMDASSPGGHSLVLRNSNAKFSELIFKWFFETQSYGEFDSSLICGRGSVGLRTDRLGSCEYRLTWRIKF